MPLVLAGRLSVVPFVASTHVYPPEVGRFNPIKRKWGEHELHDDLQLKLRKGRRLRVTNRTTPKGQPRWELEMVSGMEIDPAQVGLFPLIPLAVVAARKAAKAQKKATARGSAVRNLRPGQSTVISGVDASGALFIDTDGRRVQDGDAS